MLVWFCITLTTFRARIATMHLYLSKLYIKHYWFHFFRTRCICYVHAVCSDQLDAIAQKKLVNFVHDLMTQYFDFVCRRVQLEVLIIFSFFLTVF